MTLSKRLPSSWLLAKLSDVAEINPKLDKSEIPDDIEVSFVPMPSVEELTGRINVEQSRRFGEVKKGYTTFQEGDVLFAKITPCMENGKMAVVPVVRNGYGFGSTEFHVLRPQSGIHAKYLYYFVSSQRFRSDAEHNMTGAVGQRRVPMPYLAESEIPIPPPEEQRRIVTKIEELFSELDNGVQALTTARQQLTAYRQAIIKHAFDGGLTNDWRRKNSAKQQTLDILETQLRRTFDVRHQCDLKRWDDRGQKRQQSNRGESRPMESRTSRPLAARLDQGLGPTELPKGWNWVPLSWLLSRTKKPMTTGPFGTMLKKNEHMPTGIPVLGIENIGRGRFLQGNKIFVSEPKARELLAFAVEAGDLVISRSGTVGEICEVPNGLGTALISTNLMRISLNRDVVLPAFFVYMFQGGGSVRTQVKDLCRGSSRDFLNQSILERMMYPLCSLEEQAVVVSRVTKQLSQVEELSDAIALELSRSRSVRLAILQRAFSGQLVAQDPADESASALLERIRAQREGAKTITKYKKQGTAGNGKSGKKKAA